MTTEGRQLVESVLLGSLLLPSILLRRRDIEALNQRPISRSALRSLTQESVDTLAQRFMLSRAKVEGVQQVLWAFHRLGERWTSAASRLQFARQPGFDEALALLEIMVSATGGGGDTLESWQQIQDVRPDPPPRSRPRRKPRRHRRRRR